LPLFGIPILALGDAREASWFEARLQPLVKHQAVAYGDFICAAAEQGVVHQIELRAASQALQWLQSTPQVKQVTVSISQFSLLVPGALDQLQSLIRKADCGPEAICINVSSMDNIDYASHLHAVVREISATGARTMLDRLDDAQSQRQKGAVTECDFFRLAEQRIRPLPDQVAARCAVELLMRRLLGGATQVVAEGVANREQQDFLAKAGVRFMSEVNSTETRCIRVPRVKRRAS